MTPKSFDLVTAREMLGESRTRELEAAARADADAKRINKPEGTPDTYLSAIRLEFEQMVYTEQHEVRTIRNMRKANDPSYSKCMAKRLVSLFLRGDLPDTHPAFGRVQQFARAREGMTA